MQAQLTSVNHLADIELPHTPVSPYYTFPRISTTSSESSKAHQHHNDKASWPEQSSTTASRSNPYSTPQSPVCCRESAFLAQTEARSSPPQTPPHCTNHIQRDQHHDHNLPTPPPTPEDTRKSTSAVSAASLRLEIPHTATENGTKVTPKALAPKSYLEQYAEMRSLFMDSSQRGREEQEIMRKRDLRFATMGRKEHGMA